jgi:hypothetical protein
MVINRLGVCLHQIITMNKSTLIHNIDPDDFFKRLREMISETVSSISPIIQVEKRDELMTAEETALYFKKTTETIADWTQKGYLQKHGIGSSAIYYKRHEIENAVIPLKGKKD